MHLDRYMGRATHAHRQDREILEAFVQVPQRRALANQHGPHRSDLGLQTKLGDSPLHNADWTVQLICDHCISSNDRRLQIDTYDVDSVA